MGHDHTSAVFRFLNESCCHGCLPFGKAPRRLVIYSTVLLVSSFQRSFPHRAHTLCAVEGGE